MMVLWVHKACQSQPLFCLNVVSCFAGHLLRLLPIRWSPMFVQQAIQSICVKCGAHVVFRILVGGVSHFWSIFFFLMHTWEKQAISLTKFFITIGLSFEHLKLGYFLWLHFYQCRNWPVFFNFRWHIGYLLQLSYYFLGTIWKPYYLIHWHSQW